MSFVNFDRKSGNSEFVYIKEISLMKTNFFMTE